MKHRMIRKIALVVALAFAGVNSVHTIPSDTQEAQP